MKAKTYYIQPNPRPYTVKHADIMRNGQRVTSVQGGAPTVQHWCDLLNDAYQAGVDQGRKLALKSLAPQAALEIAIAELNGDPSILDRARELVRPTPIPITPETEVPFPCWLWSKQHAAWGHVTGRPVTVNGSYADYTHYLPDQPTMPTVVPGQ